MRRRTRRRVGRAALLLAGGLCAASAGAETRIEPRVAVGAIYVSNVELAPSGDELDDWVGELKPGITVAHESARLKLDLDYDLQGLYYVDNSDFDDYFNQFDGTGTAELVQDRVFVDLAGRYEQRNVNPAGAVTTSNLFRSGNRTDLGSWQVSPWYRQPISDVAEATLRYTYGEYNFRNIDADAENTAGSDLQDSSQQRYDVSLGSPAEAAGWTWRLDYLNNEVNYVAAPDYKYERAGAEIGLPVGSRNQFLVAGGSESNLEGDQSAGGLDSGWWNVGWRWRPTDRQTIEARVGDRFWGNDYLFHWNRKGSQGDLDLKYSEQPASFGALEFGDAGGGIYGPGRITTQVYISKRLEGSVTWDAPRSDWRLRVYWDRRDYLNDGQSTEDFKQDEEYYGILAGATWQAFTRTRIDFDAVWYDRNLEQGDASNIELGLALVRDLTPQLEARLGGAWFNQSGNSDSVAEYDAATGYLGIVWRRR